MNRKGVGLSFETLVVAIIVIIVLIVVIAIFITQSGKYVGKYGEVATKAEEEAKGCNFLFGRHCATACSTSDENQIDGKFEECRTGDNTYDKCCEKKPS